jgi:mono/diheme cytochrome c family protein
LATVRQHAFETARLHTAGFLILFALVCYNFSFAAEKVLQPVKLTSVRREPVAATFWNDSLAAIACAKSGSLIFWDVKRGEIKQEFAVGKQLRGVARIGEDELLVIDDKTHEMIRLRYSDEFLTELDRLSVAAFPTSLCVFKNRDRTQVAVASLWSRQVTVWTLAGKTTVAAVHQLARTQTIDLPFEPRHILAVDYRLPGDSLPSVVLTVTDAFGGQIAHINPWKGNSSSQRSNAHNWGGLAYNSERRSIFFSQQVLSERLPITVERLVRGKILANNLLELDTEMSDQLVPPVVTRTGPPKTKRIQIPDGPASDPGGIAFVNQRMLVCLAGTDEVWVTGPDGAAGNRFPAGKRPRFIATHESHALVLGELDDSVTLIDVSDPNALTAKTVWLDPASAHRELGPAERGERLFFDARMSAGGRMSCHSCHPDGHTNGLLGDTLGDNTHGTPKRVLSLRGTRLTDLWAWNGEMKTLQDNVHKSLQETMHAPHIKPADVDDLVSFLHTLPPVPPLKPVPRDDADQTQLTRGEKIFLREGCATCHVPPLTFTSHAVYDVGLADEKGLKKFNPPSLRGVGRLRKLFHDNRASGLREVFETHGHQLAVPLPAAELDDLIRYLESL